MPGRTRPLVALTVSTAVVLTSALVYTAVAVTPGASTPTPPPCDTRPIDQAVRDLGKLGVGIAITVRSPLCGVQHRGVGVVRKATSPTGADPITERAADGKEHSRIGSNTKSWVATVVLQLVSEGKLRLDDAVSTHLPNLIATKQYDGRKITIRQLLQHTSGLPEFTGHPDWEDEGKTRFKTFTPEDTVKTALELEPPKKTKSGFFYSNTNYNVISLIVAKVTGREIDAEIDARIIKPLGLKGTSWPGTKTTLPEPVLHGYAEGEDLTEWNTSGYGAAGALISTGADTTAFWSALMSKGILPFEQLAEMRKTVDDGSGNGYGLGIEKYDIAPDLVAWGHSGSMPSAHAFHNAVTEDGQRGVSVMVGSDEEISERVEDVIHDLIRDLR